MTADSYAGAPSIVSEMATVVTMAAALDERSTLAARHELAVRRSAVLDRIALEHPGDVEASIEAIKAALALTRLAAEHAQDHGWAPPMLDPLAYTRAEYRRWASQDKEPKTP
ncbi:hypothetical protein [Embleya sp. NPDC059237]|uniref:hypothetical protein n=1 Tax=Embleya sp. NPDC059237 TaxID=3346784 RepID=UPI0036A627FE